MFEAPETRNDNFSTKSDCWSIGVLLYRLLSLLTDTQSTNVKPSPYLSLHMVDLHESLEHNLLASDEVKDLIYGLLLEDPEKRLSCEEALEHPWFDDLPRPSIQSSMRKSLMSIFDYQSDNILRRESANLLV